MKLFFVLSRFRSRLREIRDRALNPYRKHRLARRRGLRLHVGCGNTKLAGFTNVDVRPTPAVDLITDLNHFDLFDGNASLIFSNAFFEHLFRPNRVTHLKGAWRALSPDGVLCYIGIPNFRVVARYYLEGGPGTAGPLFDLYNVYRYTHGDPEQAPTWYLEQLHKSLFDEDELRSLLDEAGIDDFVLFRYAYPDDLHPVPLNLGLYAVKSSAPRGLVSRCRDFLATQSDRVQLDTVDFVADQEALDRPSGARES